MTTPARSSGWRALAITLAVQALVSLAVFTVPTMAPAMAQLLGVSPTLIGAYIAVLYAGAMIATLVAGPLVMRFGAIRVSQLGLLVCAAGLSLMALAPGVAPAAIGAFLVGMGYGPITPASSHLLARTTPAHRTSLVFSIKQSGVPLGGVMAGAIVPGLLIAGGVDAALLAVAAANVACALAAEPMRPVLDADREPGRPLGFTSIVAPLRLVLSHADLARLSRYSFVFATVQMALATYIVTYLHTALGYGLVAAGAVLSTAQVGGVVGRIVWGYIADRWLAPRHMLAVLAGLMALCCGATGALQAGSPLPLVLAIMVVFGASATGWNGVYLAEVARLAPDGQASAATGGSLAVTFLGVVLGPVLFAMLTGAFDTYRAGYLALVMPAAFCGWRLMRSTRRIALA